MVNKEAMASYSNLMLVKTIYGNSGKYSQDDVLNAELELCTRNVSDNEMEELKNKVAYISGINVENSSGVSSSMPSIDN